MAQCRHLILILHRKACYFENSVLPDDRLLFATLGRSAFFYNFSIMSCLFELVIQSILLLFPLIGGLQWKLFFFTFFILLYCYSFSFCDTGFLQCRCIKAETSGKKFFPRFSLFCIVIFFRFVIQVFCNVEFRISKVHFIIYFQQRNKKRLNL